LVVLAAALLSASFLIEPVKLQLFPEGAQAEKDVNFDATMYGSGRPIIWKEYMEFFRGMPIDRQIAGIGIGNTGTQPWNDGLPYDTHNDWLQVLVFSGYVGLLLFVALNLALLRNILTLSGRERHLFIALFSAVAIMNFVSNSYVSRFGLGQMYYMLLAYVEVRRMGTSRSPGFRRRADVGLTGISQKSEAAQEETH
jgi:O-antigen ligase